MVARETFRLRCPMSLVSTFTGKVGTSPEDVRLSDAI